MGGGKCVGGNRMYLLISMDLFWFCIVLGDEIWTDEKLFFLEKSTGFIYKKTFIVSKTW